MGTGIVFAVFGRYLPDHPVNSMVAPPGATEMRSSALAVPAGSRGGCP